MSNIPYLHKYRRNLGTLNISLKLLETLTTEQLAKIFSSFFVVRCEHVYSMRYFRYEAISEHFEEVEEGCMPPEYEIVVTETGHRFVKR